MPDEDHDPFLHDPSAFERSIASGIRNMDDRIERLEEALRRIADWGIAYPEDAFPPPGEHYYANAHRILTAHTMSLDRIAADCMRHAVQGCARIAQEALDGDVT